MITERLALASVGGRRLERDTLGLKACERAGYDQYDQFSSSRAPIFWEFQDVDVTKSSPATDIGAVVQSSSTPSHLESST